MPPLMYAQRSPGCFVRRRDGLNKGSDMLVLVTHHDVIDMFLRSIKRVGLRDQQKPSIVRRRIVAYEIIPIGHCMLHLIRRETR